MCPTLLFYIVSNAKRLNSKRENAGNQGANQLLITNWSLNALYFVISLCLPVTSDDFTHQGPMGKPACWAPLEQYIQKRNFLVLPMILV
jgi:hypothetical protein